jgi:DNA primase
MTTVEVSRPDKVLFRDAGVTKADMHDGAQALSAASERL